MGFECSSLRHGVVIQAKKHAIVKSVSSYNIISNALAYTLQRQV
jgi:hypothetical protein